MMRIGIIGDIHGHFSDADIDYFNNSAEDLLLITGDLARAHGAESLKMARRLAELRKPTLFIPGNHDAVTLPQLLMEIRPFLPLRRLFARGMENRVAALQTALGPVQIGGYSTHQLKTGDFALDLIVARPFAMGGSQISYPDYLRQRYGVKDKSDSIAQLQQCVDAAAGKRLVFLAHNGPTGLGGQKESIWGCDFRAEGGDFGDSDLAAAVAYARRRGKQVLAVIGGHMHLRVKGGGERPFTRFHSGTLYINAARVPRIFTADDRTWRHYLRLTITKGRHEVEEIFLES